MREVRRRARWNAAETPRRNIRDARGLLRITRYARSFNDIAPAMCAQCAQQK